MGRVNEVVINIDVMTDDAEQVWEDASDRLLAAKAAIPEIATPDFSRPFGAPELAAAYSEAAARLGRYLEQGSDEFLLFERRLLMAVKIYGEAHEMSAAQIAALEAEMVG